GGGRAFSTPPRCPPPTPGPKEPAASPPLGPPAPRFAGGGRGCQGKHPPSPPPPPLGGGGDPPAVLSGRHFFVVGCVLVNAIIGMVTYVTLLERKFAARMQSRIGPYRVGPHGLLQPIADALKLMMKEDVVPRTADRAVYNLAPIVFLIPCMLIFATLPFAPGLGVADLN